LFHEVSFSDLKLNVTHIPTETTNTGFYDTSEFLKKL